MENQKTSIWEQVLNEASTNKESEETHVFIFGDKNAGKRSLVKAINKELYLNYENEERTLPHVDEQSSRYSLMEYKYLNVKKANDIENEILGKMNVWLVNDFLNEDFINTILKPHYLQKALFLIVLDLSKPGELLDQIKKWTNFILEKFSKLLLKLPYDKQQEIQKNLENYIKLYEEPKDEVEGEENREKEDDKPSEETIQLKLEMPLKEGLLGVNIGIPFIFVVNKSDIATSQNEKKRFEEDSEFILKHLRKSALKCKTFL